MAEVVRKRRRKRGRPASCASGEQTPRKRPRPGSSGQTQFQADFPNFEEGHICHTSADLHAEHDLESDDELKVNSSEPSVQDLRARLRVLRSELSYLQHLGGGGHTLQVSENVYGRGRDSASPSNSHRNSRQADVNRNLERDAGRQTHAQRRRLDDPDVDNLQESGRGSEGRNRSATDTTIDLRSKLLARRPPGDGQTRRTVTVGVPDARIEPDAFTVSTTRPQDRDNTCKARDILHYDIDLFYAADDTNNFGMAGFFRSREVKAEPGLSGVYNQAGSQFSGDRDQGCGQKDSDRQKTARAQDTHRLDNGTARRHTAGHSSWREPRRSPHYHPSPRSEETKRGVGTKTRNRGHRKGRGLGNTSPTRNIDQRRRDRSGRTDRDDGTRSPVGTSRAIEHTGRRSTRGDRREYRDPSPEKQGVAGRGRTQPMKETREGTQSTRETRGGTQSIRETRGGTQSIRETRGGTQPIRETEGRSHPVRKTRREKQTVRETREGTPSDRQPAVDYGGFVHKVNDYFAAGDYVPPDTICVFFSQNLNHVTHLVRKPEGRSRDTADKLLELLRKSLVESSPLLGVSRFQILSCLKGTFFQSPLVCEVSKALLSTQGRCPDEADMRGIKSVIDVLKVFVKNRLLSHPDTRLFLIQFKAVLQGLHMVAGGQDRRQMLLDSLEDIEEHILQDNEPREEILSTDVDSADTDLQLLPILPDIADIRRNRPTEIKPRNVLDLFCSSSEYVRYIFLAFREDFVGPLRAAIQEYIAHISRQRRQCPDRRDPDWRPRFRNQSVRLYQDVKVIDSALSQDTGVDVKIKIDSSRIRNFNSRLVFGSLVCLSSDDFQSVLYATVKDRDPGTLKAKGHVNIHLLSNEGVNVPEQHPHHGEQGEGQVEVAVLKTRSFTMLESTAFYTSYLHPLQALRALHQRVASRPSDLPFRMQLLELKKDLGLPQYLETSEGYMSFACMKRYALKFVENYRLGNNSKADSSVDAAGRETMPSHQSIPPKEQYKDVCIRKPETWPPAEHLGMDVSQNAALRHALTQRLALIQGPPGTGKTTLGIRIAELLLENEHLWREDECMLLEKTPLLLISYTNHALDQFLTELVQLPVLRYMAFEDCPHHVVRIGRRCEDERLARHMLVNLRKIGRKRRSGIAVDQGILSGLRLSREMLDQKVAFYKDGIIHEQTLKEKDVILEKHFHAFQSGNDLPTIVKWLGLHEPECLMTGDRVHQRNPRELRPAEDAPTRATARAHARVEDVVMATVGKECDEDDDEESGELDVEDDVLDKRLLDVDDDDDYLSDKSDDEKRPWYAPVMAVKAPDLRRDTDSELSASGVLFASFEHRVADMIQQMIKVNDVMTDGEEKNVKNIWKLNKRQRWRLYRLWLSRVIAKLLRERDAEEAEFRRVSDRVLEQRDLQDLRIMKRARVVAMTTTAASRMTSILHELRARVVIVEEAAQVSEAHLLSSLSTSCRHLILIGDHQQLRPAYNNYDLTSRHHRHHIDISLFERLCRGGVPFRRLALQHRMRPEISSLLVPTIYSDLHDHWSVTKLPHVQGLAHDVFFVDHAQPEDRPEESKSRRNTHEAEFLAGFYRHLRLQGYSEKDITVLALYKEQVFLLRKLIKEVESKDPLIPRPPQFEEDTLGCRPGKGPARETGARVTAVDNFQGEENRIILLSLVRSNQGGNIGYLREPNRICVALSRAKEGLFVIGNLSMLSDKSPNYWRPILEQAKGRQILGPALPLRCTRHPDHVTNVVTKDDFKTFCPNGGCNKSCDFRRDCGHACDRQCHDPGKFHFDPCAKPCARTCQKGHPCPGTCSEPCRPCQQEVEVTMTLCGHVVGVPCCQRDSTPFCPARCERRRGCGHQCSGCCGMDCATVNCTELVKVTCAGGHEFQVACFSKDAANCTIPCSAVLECGHACPGTCGSCFAGRLHVPCSKECKRLLVCGHLCREKCTKSCPPCREKCQVRCAHSTCGKKCGDACTPCAEPCQWRCRQSCPNRFRCSNTCSDSCQRPRCDTPCRKLLRCSKCDGHYRCRGLLCEPSCPQTCPRCDDKVFECFFGTEDDAGARFYKMWDCACVVEVTGLDHFMDQDDAHVGGKKCPKCTTPVINSFRYGNVLKRCASAVAAVKRKLQLDQDGTVQSARNRLLKTIQDKDLVSQLHVDVDFLTSLESLERIRTFENRAHFLEAIREMRGKLDKGNKQVDEAAGGHLSKASRQLDRLKDWTMLKRWRCFDEQQCREFKRELKRTELSILLSIAVTNMRNQEENSDTYRDVVENLRRLEDNATALRPEEEADLGRRIESIRGRWISGLGVSEAERLMIVQTMGFKPGHWYKCPNGHVYLIGECGGAMEQSTCPECHVTIGGTSHRLTEGNTVATEMDGARHGAWSEQANMANYEIP